jgi:hypothetical protein
MEKVITYIFFVVVLASCWKEEIPIKADPSNGDDSVLIRMGIDYGNQLWFDINERRIVQQNRKDTWDFGFKKVHDNVYVRLNTANAATALSTNTIELSDITSNPSGAIFRTDHPNGSLDSLAIGSISFPSNVYIINRGFSTTGQSLGNWKVRFISYENNEITFEMARMNGANLRTVTVDITTNQSWSCYSIESNQRVDWEPDEQWHFCFTQYSHVFYEPYQPYLVTGVLINPSTTQVAEINDKSFEEIDLIMATQLSYSSNADIIGYDWKFYDFDLQLFTMEEQMLFVVNTISGDYYKLRFTDFYDEEGQRGAPKFDLVAL